MNARIAVLLAMVMLSGTAASAAVRNEWTFKVDSAGRTLAEAVNSGTDNATFSADIGKVTQTDGIGGMACTNDVVGAGNFWTDGAILDAAITMASSGIRYLRYDLDYDMTADSNDSGTLLGLAFTDGAGGHLAGIALNCDVGSGATPPAGVTNVTFADDLELTGSLSVIAKLDLDSQTIDVWYNLSGDNIFSASNAPDQTMSGLNLASIDELQFRATGDFIAPFSSDCVVVDNIRTADSWTEITAEIAPPFDPKYINEWIFDRDKAGRTLSSALNTGTDGADFSTDTNGVTQTDGERYLVCSNEVVGTGNFWTDGVILNADVTNQASGVRFLRYDLDYDMTADSNDSGTLLGLAFTDGAGGHLAGIALNCDVGSGATPPAGVTNVTFADDLELTGSLSVIAKLDLDSQTMEVWYDLSGNNSFNASNSPNETISDLSLGSIDELEFRATGDFIASSSNGCVSIDNIRTAATWDEITEPVIDLMSSPFLTVSISDSLGGGMEIGGTNTVYVVIDNRGGPATQVTSVLSHNAGSALSIVSSNNAPVDVGAGGTTSNTYLVVANAIGSFVLSATASSAETISGVATFDLVVGAHISFVSPPVITNENGIISGELEPDETLDLIITSINDGGKSINNITNSLISANPQYFTELTNSTANIYTSLSVGSETSTTYRLTCSGSIPDGPQTFYVINSTGSESWTNSFSLNVFNRAAPSVSTNALTITLVSGETAQTTVVLSNDGNVDISYDVTGDTPWTTYLVQSGGDIDSTVTVRRVTYGPVSGSLASMSSQSITVAADATGQPVGTTNFTLTVHWGDGTTNTVNVALVVENANPQLTVTPATLSFSGPAGFISKDSLTVSNSGNITLDYKIIDYGAATNGYGWTNVLFNWENVQQQDIHEFDFSVGADSEVTPQIPLKFAFPFYGGVYTNCSVSVDGEILFGDDAVVGPYRGDLIFDANSDIRYSGDENHFAVVWENLRQKNGAYDLTFQAIIYKSGVILFQYKLLSNTNCWPYTDIGLLYDNLVAEASLANRDTATYTTNYNVVTNGWNGDWPIVSTNGTNVVVTYHTTISSQAVRFSPAEPIIFSVDPSSGTISPDESNTIVVLGDARSLISGGTNSLVVATRFDFLSDAPTASVAITFTATNSIDGSFPPVTAAMSAAMWGTEEVPLISIETSVDGARTLSWPSAQDSLSRTYIVWYTGNLTMGWIELARLDNLTSYADNKHNDDPVIFYKVTVQ